MAALRTDEILRQEASEIFGAKFSGQTGQELYRSFNHLKSAALCISGGGIRSAAFALGVIQALAIHPRPAPNLPTNSAERSLLSNFHYLSTVSGGGYIGSWLSAWISRADFPQVWEKLIGRPNGPDREPAMISWLRDYSNYLTPKLGLTSADTWTAVALFLRNLILNWFIIIPVLCFVLLLLKWYAGVIEVVAKVSPLEGNGLLATFAGIGLLCLIFALQFTTRNRPTRGNYGADQKRFLLQDLVPVIGFGALCTLALALARSHVYVRELPCCSTDTDLASYTCLGWLAVIGGLAGAATYAIAWGIAYLPIRDRFIVSDLVLWTISGFLFGALMGLGLWIYSSEFVHPFWIFKSSEIILIVFAVPWALFALLLAEMIFVGLSSREKDSDADREWFGRAAGWYLVVVLAWLILMILVFIGSDLAATLFVQFKTWLGPLGGVSGVVTAVLGKSKATPAKGDAKGPVGVSANFILAVTAPLFAIVLIIAASAILDQIVFGMPLTNTKFWKAPVTDVTETFQFPVETLWLLLWILIFGFIGAIASAVINVNRFSLHALYRNRIIRAFLGGSNPRRNPNRFTDFDVADNLRMFELWPPRGAATPLPSTCSNTWRPFHVVNMALNIVSTKKLAWQQRKAEPFTVSPLHSGSSCVDPDSEGFRVGGFRDSKAYGDDRGISLGTAIAISGAAASPSMGYHSSPPLAFLLTLFNARLGWWLGNPGTKGESTYKGEGPSFALLPLFYEMFGLTTDENEYVYLSDGGHFENLALYEMVRRRCQFILLSDAGCDPDFAFEDLGNAVRKISLDLGVTIDFQGLHDLKSREQDEESGCCDPHLYAIGTIDYSSADDGENKEKSSPGLILYIKPTYRKGVIRNIGVGSYATVNPDFPHQDTADQWFDESQFESYRALGFEITDQVLSQAIAEIPSTGPIKLDDVITKLATLLPS